MPRIHPFIEIFEKNISGISRKKLSRYNAEFEFLGFLPQHKIVININQYDNKQFGKFREYRINICFIIYYKGEYQDLLFDMDSRINKNSNGYYCEDCHHYQKENGLALTYFDSFEEVLEHDFQFFQQYLDSTRLKNYYLVSGYHLYGSWSGALYEKVTRNDLRHDENSFFGNWAYYPVWTHSPKIKGLNLFNSKKEIKDFLVKSFHRKIDGLREKKETKNYQIKKFILPHTLEINHHLDLKNKVLNFRISFYVHYNDLGIIPYSELMEIYFVGDRCFINCKDRQSQSFLNLEKALEFIFKPFKHFIHKHLKSKHFLAFYEEGGKACCELVNEIPIELPSHKAYYLPMWDKKLSIFTHGANS